MALDFREINFAKKNYYNHKFSDIQGNSKEIWKTINSIQLDAKMISQSMKSRLITQIALAIRGKLPIFSIIFPILVLN